jgi:hypothetical protein
LAWRAEERQAVEWSALLLPMMAHGLKRHWHEETVDARLAATPAAVYARRSIFIPIENPIITILARER